MRLIILAPDRLYSHSVMLQRWQSLLWIVLTDGDRQLLRIPIYLVAYIVPHLSVLIDSEKLKGCRMLRHELSVNSLSGSERGGQRHLYEIRVMQVLGLWVVDRTVPHPGQFQVPRGIGRCEGVVCSLTYDLNQH